MPGQLGMPGRFAIKPAARALDAGLSWHVYSRTLRHRRRSISAVWTAVWSICLVQAIDHEEAAVLVLGDWVDGLTTNTIKLADRLALPTATAVIVTSPHWGWSPALGEVRNSSLFLLVDAFEGSGLPPDGMVLVGAISMDSIEWSNGDIWSRKGHPPEATIAAHPRTHGRRPASPRFEVTAAAEAKLAVEDVTTAEQAGSVAENALATATATEPATAGHVAVAREAAPRRGMSATVGHGRPAAHPSLSSSQLGVASSDLANGESHDRRVAAAERGSLLLPCACPPPPGPPPPRCEVASRSAHMPRRSPSACPRDVCATERPALAEPRTTAELPAPNSATVLVMAY